VPAETPPALGASSMPICSASPRRLIGFENDDTGSPCPLHRSDFEDQRLDGSLAASARPMRPASGIAHQLASALVSCR
jgi:hypothetical protein